MTSETSPSKTCKVRPKQGQEAASAKGRRILEASPTQCTDIASIPTGVIPGTAVDTTSSCLVVITAADKALAAKNKALELSNLAIKTCKEETGRCHGEVNELRDSNASFWHNPVVMFVFGAAAGVLTYTLLKK